jgi:hypothetical protein
MTEGFIFNSGEVLRLLAMVSGVIACFLAVGSLVYLASCFVEDDCRNDIRFDKDGKRDDVY